MSEIKERIFELYKTATKDSGLQPTSDNFQQTLDDEKELSAMGAPPEYRKMILDSARKNLIPPSLVDAVMRHESNYKNESVSPAGAQGLMQLMPSTQKDLGISDPFDPEQSIDGGTRYLRMMADRFNGDLEKTVAAYNAGPGAVEKHGGVPPYRETQNYVRKILNDLGTGFDAEG